jgi:molybdenum cofactor synthesis domain-containing protein
MFKVAILTISDRSSRGEREDVSGEIIKKIVKEKLGFEIIVYEIIPDEKEIIKEKLLNFSENLKVDLVLTTGGTGFSERDVTPEATKEIIEKEAPGIAEVIRMEGLKKTKRAMLSRGVSGIRKKTLIINLPGSPKGVEESLDAIIPALFHGLEILKGISCE